MDPARDTNAPVVSPREYAAAWDSYRRRLWGLAVATLFGIPAAVLVIVRQLMPDAAGFVLALGILGTWILLWMRALWWKCPRCNKPFFANSMIRNPFARKCLHCKLPKWAVTESRQSGEESTRGRASTPERALVISMAYGGLLAFACVAGLPTAWILINSMIANAPELCAEQATAMRQLLHTLLIYSPIKGVCGLVLSIAAARTRSGSGRARAAARICTAFLISLIFLFLIDPDHGWKAYRLASQSLFVDPPRLFRALVNTICALAPLVEGIFNVWLFVALGAGKGAGQEKGIRPNIGAGKGDTSKY